MSREILELTRTRVRHLLREPEIVFWTFIFPIMLALVVGLAFGGDSAKDYRVAVLDGPEMGQWAAALRRAGQLDVETFEDRETAVGKLRAGSVLVLLESGKPLRLRYDPTRPESDTARLRVEDAIQRAAGRVDPVQVHPREEEGTGTRYVDWLIPGLIGLNLMSTGIWGIGFAIVEARQKRLLKRFLVTPMSRLSYLLSFACSRLVFMVLEVAAIVLFACLLLGVPFRGNVLSFALLCVIGTVSFGGLAILIGSRARTAEGVGGLIYLVFMPMGLSSGVFFSYENFSSKLQPIIKALPLASLNDALRANMLEGASIASVLPEIGIQLLWGAGCFLLGLKLFRWN